MINANFYTVEIQLKKVDFLEQIIIIIIFFKLYYIVNQIVVLMWSVLKSENKFLFFQNLNTTHRIQFRSC